MTKDSDQESANSRFRTTAWSIVTAAQDRAAPDYQASIEYLCRRYWKPVYSYIRRRGWNHEQACDHAQEYFAVFLEKSYVEAADQTRGKFRTFILTTLSRFLSKQHRKAKRHGNAVSLNISHGDDDLEYTRPELSSTDTAEDEFNRNWARSLIERTLELMKKSCTDGRQKAYCTVFQTYLDSTTSLHPKTYREIGLDLGLSETDVTNYLHRGRNIFQKLLREEVRQSVLTESEIDDELEELHRHFG